MLAIVEPVTLFCAASLVIFALYVVALWTYAFTRTGSISFVLLLVAGIIALGVSLANVALVYDGYLGIHLLGRSAWKIFYYVFVCIQPVEALLSVIGLTMLVTRVTRKGLTNRSSEPPTGDNVSK
jgi:hypothetical protein